MTEISLVSSSCSTNKQQQSVVISSHPRKIQIFVKSLQTTTKSIKIYSNSSIYSLKKSICISERITHHHQRLASEYRVYQHDSRFSDKHDHNSTMTLVGRLMGGNPDDNPRIMPVTWWLGFGCSYQDGRANIEGQICNVLTEFKFDGKRVPTNWYSSLPLSQWCETRLIESDDHVIMGIGSLKIHFCRMKALPYSIGKLISLTRLNVCYNRLTCLPESIGLLVSLTHLDLFENYLTTLPDSIKCLTSLIKLHVARNELTSLRESIGNLSSLTELWLSHNKLTLLPDSIRDMSSLVALHCSDNPVTSSEQGKNEVMSQFNRAGLSISV